VKVAVEENGMGVVLYYVLKSEKAYHGEDSGLRMRKINRLHRKAS
jgi:hypothetical protein